LSSGTWSLMGVELEEPIINEQTREFNFTNELGFGDSVRLLKNISGLWLMQECKRQWEKEGKQFHYSQLAELAKAAKPFKSLINPASEEFLSPVNMVEQISDYCGRTKQSVPQTEGEFIRCVLESLALLYKKTLEQIEAIIGKRIECLHIVGGGSKNELLNQFTANACNTPVLAGPAEATAAGNVCVQAIAMGEINDLNEAREIVRRSIEISRFEPEKVQEWEEAFGRFSALL